MQLQISVPIRIISSKAHSRKKEETVSIHYWTDLEHELLAQAGSLEEAAAIAVTILERMRETGRPIVQICGPISTGGLGSVAANMERFRRAIDTALERGLLVFDQLPFQEAIVRLTDFREGDAAYRMEILEIFYRNVFQSGHVSITLFLPGWENSFGARWERALVAQLGIAIQDYPLEWLE